MNCAERVVRNGPQRAYPDWFDPGSVLDDQEEGAGLDRKARKAGGWGLRIEQRVGWIEWKCWRPSGRVVCRDRGKTGVIQGRAGLVVQEREDTWLKGILFSSVLFLLKPFESRSIRCLLVRR